MRKTVGETVLATEVRLDCVYLREVVFTGVQMSEVPVTSDVLSVGKCRVIGYRLVSRVSLGLNRDKY